MGIEFTKHALDMLKERGIPEAWALHVIQEPDRKDEGLDGNVHYFKGIPEYDGRILHVVVNPNSDTVKVVTVFFDRRARRPV